MLISAKTSENNTFHRSGSIGILLLLLFLGFMILFAWVFNVGFTWTIHAELRRTADASALAGTLVLVDDVHLKGYLYGQTPTGMDLLIDQAHDRAKAIALQNPVNGVPFVLMDNLNNLPDGDIVFGFVDNSTNVNFIPATNVNDPNNLDLINVNAVKIRALKLLERGTELKLFYPGLTTRTHQDIGSTALAIMDRDVIGFKSVYDSTIPLAPIAFLADFGGLPNILSWQWQIEDTSNLLAQDNFKFDGSPGPDGLREFTAKIDYVIPSVNTRFLFLNATDTAGNYAAINAQLLVGLTTNDLTPYGGQLVLDANNELLVKSSGVGPSGGDQTTFETNLAILQATNAVRIWPLYDTDVGGQSRLRGFVAARIVQINKVGTGLELVMQPTMLATSTAVTNFNQRNAGGISILNKYISKVRLVDE